MAGFRDALGLVDRPHLPAPGAGNSERFKEWFHFNLLGLPGGADVIVNVSFSADVTRAGGGRTDVIALCHRPGHGWAGGVDSYDGAAAEFDTTRLALRVGDAVSLRYDAGAYQLNLRQRGGLLALRATLTPRAEPMLLWNDTPLGTGSLNWLIAPHLEASGELRLGNERIQFDDICAYHDHNWGYWKWGEDFGWEWGFATDMQRRVAEGRLTAVFDRTSDRLGGASFEHTLAVWRDEMLLKVFTRHMLRAQREGSFQGDIPRQPGAAWMIAPGTVQTVPRHFRVSARDQDDWLDVEYHVGAALQVSVPSEFGFGVLGLNETFGQIAISGMLKGETVKFSTRAAFEFLG